MLIEFRVRVSCHAASPWFTGGDYSHAGGDAKDFNQILIKLSGNRFGWPSIARAYS
jgi:hypothetical protein